MKIYVYPRDKNPYQGLLYGAMKKSEKVKISYDYFLPFFGSLHIFFTAALRRMLGYRIIHIHWPAFKTNLPLPFQKQLSYFIAKGTIRWLKILQFKIVWTIHNVTPHEAQTSNDLDIARRLASTADLKIVHSPFTITQMRAKGMNLSNIKVIPHGNYIGHYPDTISKVDSRSRLRIKNREFVILFFGLIRPYKGVDDLLSTFMQIAKKNPTARLVIAGKCLDDDLRGQIQIAQKTYNIDFYPNYIKDEEVALYFKACDVVCLPFKALTTSGSALLALSFGTPIIAPREGALHDFPDNIGYLYRPQDSDALRISIMNAAGDSTGLEARSQAALAFAKTLNWDIIAETTYSLYSNISEKTAK